jgi:hypothetical protein
LGFGICPSFKGQFLSRRAKPQGFDSQLLHRCKAAAAAVVFLPSSQRRVSTPAAGTPSSSLRRARVAATTTSSPLLLRGGGKAARPASLLRRPLRGAGAGVVRSGSGSGEVDAELGWWRVAGGEEEEAEVEALVSPLALVQRWKR